jgi:hypothetical protein
VLGMVLDRRALGAEAPERLDQPRADRQIERLGRDGAVEEDQVMAVSASRRPSLVQTSPRRPWTRFR